jgi:hypothetical protein
VLNKTAYNKRRELKWIQGALIMGTDFPNFRLCTGLCYKFSQQTISKSSKCNQQQEFSTRSTRNKWRGSTMFSLASAATLAIKKMKVVNNMENNKHSTKILLCSNEHLLLLLA